MSGKITEPIKYQEQLKNLIEQKQKLSTQLNEIQMAKDEIDRLDNEATIYKLVGPLMLPQKLPEVKENMNARLKYLNENMDYYEKEAIALQNKFTK